MSASEIGRARAAKFCHIALTAAKPERSAIINVPVMPSLSRQAVTRLIPAIDISSSEPGKNIPMDQKPARKMPNPAISSPQAARALALVPPTSLHPAPEITEYISKRGMTRIRRHNRLATVARTAIFLVAGLNEFEISQRSNSVNTAERAIVEEKAREEIFLERRFSLVTEGADASLWGDGGV